MESPHILYAAAIRLPTEKAHGLQILKMCEALAENKAVVELCIPGRKSPIREDPFAYYGIRTRFPITTLRVPDSTALGRYGFLLLNILFALRVAVYARRSNPDVLYTRDKILALLLARLKPRGTRVVWEVHGKEPASVIKKLSGRVQFVAITQGVKNMLAQGGATGNILVAPDGVDLRDFEQVETKEAARERLGLPQDARIAIYIGRLDGWKGVPTLLEASKLLPEDILVAIIGGEPRQVEDLHQKYPRVRFLGYRPYREVAGNQMAADVLILPNTAKDETSALYTSPLKLFSYMASGKPIIASDLPSIREVLDETDAYLFQPDEPKSLAGTIAMVFSDMHAEEKTAKAKAEIMRYVWDTRAKSILSHI